jgi:hypothetical protein
LLTLILPALDDVAQQGQAPLVPNLMFQQLLAVEWGAAGALFGQKSFELGTLATIRNFSRRAGLGYGRRLAGFSRATRNRFFGSEFVESVPRQEEMANGAA